MYHLFINVITFVPIAIKDWEVLISYVLTLWRLLTDVFT